MRFQFDWDAAKAASNARKHDVSFEEAMFVFSDPLALSVIDLGSAQEERWITIGETGAGKLLVVVHTWVDIDADRSLVRIISARRPTRNEIRQYRESSLE